MKLRTIPPEHYEMTIEQKLSYDTMRRATDNMSVKQMRDLLLQTAQSVLVMGNIIKYLMVDNND